MANQAGDSLQLQSLAKRSGELELSLIRTSIPEPGPDEIVIRVEATPINPSDLGGLLGAADVTSLRSTGTADLPQVTFTIPERGLSAMANRMDQAIPVGNEGAGTVIAAGSSPQSQALLGTVVAVLGGAMYAQHRVAKASDVLPLPKGTSPVDGASCFVNPLTALSMVDAMRREGHKALVHTAAASNLGQMLNKICIADGVDLVNIVRSDEQAELLRGIGAKYVVDSSKPTFMEDLIAALVETGATIAFDAIGGGKLAGRILTAMEIAAAKTTPLTAASRYGTTVYKQVYIYGGLDTGPTELARSFGFAWGLGGFLLMPYLAKIGAGEAEKLRQRVVAELTTTFASHYVQTISLREALDPAILAAYARRATGEKYLINPSL